MSKSMYAQRMSKLAARIFGQVSRPTDSKSMKVVQIFSGKPPHLDKAVTDYYPKHVELTNLLKHLRYNGLFRNEAEDFKEQQRLRKAKAGKSKPKKGEGKRAMRKK